MQGFVVGLVRTLRVPGREDLALPDQHLATAPAEPLVDVLVGATALANARIEVRA